MREIGLLNEVEESEEVILEASAEKQTVVNEIEFNKGYV